MPEINFLSLARKKIYTKSDIVKLFILGLIFLSTVIFFPLAGIIVLIIVGIIIVAFRLEWGIYLIAVVSFLHGWEINFSRYEWARDIPWLAGLNAPLVDFIALGLMASLLIAYNLKLSFFQTESTPRRYRSFRHVIIRYGLFIVWAAIAARFSFENNDPMSFRYLFQPMFFVFFAYVLIPVVVIRSEIVLETILKIWYWVGIAAAGFGLSSLFVINDVIRLTPYTISGWAPWGFNHNLLAETLVILVPVGVYFSYRQSKLGLDNRWYVYGTIFMALVALFTFSRAAWLVIALEAGIFFIIQKQRGWWSWTEFFFSQRIWLLTLGLVMAAIITMTMFLNSATVKNSTLARWDTTLATGFFVAKSPWLGYGPGMFQTVLNRTEVYILEYGESFDAHGFLQKVSLETGVPGFIFFVGFLISILYFLWKTYRISVGHKQILLGCLYIMTMGAIVFQLFNTSYFNSVMWMPLGVSLAAVALKENNQYE